MSTKLKKFIADVVSAGAAAVAVLAVVLNVVHGLNVPAADIAWVTGAIAVVTAVVNLLRPYAATVVRTVFKD